MSRRDIIAIGGSTGAIDAVRRLCRELPANLAATVLIVIHVGAEGQDLLAGIFAAEGQLPARTAAEGDILTPGHIYVAPADHHLLVIDGVVRLGRGPRENMARPAIDPLFRSLAAGFGPRVIAVVLSGMLNDGAAGLADVKRCGGVTVVQSPADAIAPDMPLGALAATDVDYRAPLRDMAALLVELVGQDAGTAIPVPERIRSEVAIALGRRADSAILAEFANPAALSCPACAGVLSEVKESPPLRFRCQVGHAYTAETLWREKEGAVEEALRLALRIIEERVVLTLKMAEDARASGRHAAAASYANRAEDSAGHAEILRRAIESS